MHDLEEKLKEAKSSSRFLLIATDGVFSMDGSIANLKEICSLADKYGAMTMIDDSHAVGFMGKHGKGTHEHNEVMGRIDIITGTGKALCGASGDYGGRNEMIAMLVSARVHIFFQIRLLRALQLLRLKYLSCFRNPLTLGISWKATLNILERIYLKPV
jgi:glycine C-acetyltransferase